MAQTRTSTADSDGKPESRGESEHPGQLSALRIERFPPAVRGTAKMKRPGAERGTKGEHTGRQSDERGRIEEKIASRSNIVPPRPTVVLDDSMCAGHAGADAPTAWFPQGSLFRALF